MTPELWMMLSIAIAIGFGGWWLSEPINIKNKNKTNKK
jgi:hypothetical protein